MAWNGQRFSIYDSEEKTVLKMMKDLGDQTNSNTDTLDTKTDKTGNHEGSWQGLDRPTMSQEGLMATVENLLVQVKDISISVKDYGALGNGVNDDTLEIQATLDYVESLGGGKVIFPTSSGNYMISDTIKIGANTTVEFMGKSYLQLTQPTSIGTVMINKPLAKNILIVNPLINGGGSVIITGSSGQNGISCSNGEIFIIGGHIKNCARGTGNGDGGKGIQVESFNCECIAIGTKIESCHKTLSSHRDFTNAGKIIAMFSNIHGLNCDQFAIVTQTNGSDLTGLEHSIVIDNFISENCGTIDGVVIFSRAANVTLRGKVIGTSTPTAIIRGRHSRSNIDIEVMCNATSIIDLNPSTYGLDTGIAQGNIYNINMHGTYDYIVKSDTTGVTYANRSLQKSVIKGYMLNDATIGLCEGNGKSADTTMDIICGDGKKYKGDTAYLVNYLENKFATVDKIFIPTLLNSWTNNDGATRDNAGYIKDSQGIVSLKGQLTGTNASPIFTLPVGFRPSMMLYRPVFYFNGSTWVQTMLNIYPTGNVQLSGAPTNLSFLIIGGVSFKAEQ